MTYSGIVFRPLEPEPELIVLADVAHALANSCRFTGHVSSFYSVAEHSVRCSDLLQRAGYSKREQKNALLHDASEAYLSDIARPVKRQPGFGEMYDGVEEPLMYAVAERFGINWPMTEAVHWADEVLLRTEQRDLMHGDYPREAADEWFPEPLKTLNPEQAEDAFRNAYVKLFG